jgi:hypothetical protein
MDDYVEKAPDNCAEDADDYVKEWKWNQVEIKEDR